MVFRGQGGTSDLSAYACMIKTFSLAPKEKIFKSHKVKKTVMYQGTYRQMTSDFLSETMQMRKVLSSSKYKKIKNGQPRFLFQTKLS